MTQTELFNALKATGYPVAYSHFSKDPSVPYLTYAFAYNGDMTADNINYLDISNFQIELYTETKDLAAEKKVQDKLKELQLPYSKTEIWLNSEKLYQIIYEIQLIGG